MNSSLQKALAASLMAIGASTAAIGQGLITSSSVGGWDYDPNCIDPNNTAPFSADYNVYRLENDLMASGIGVQGTVSWKFCNPVGPAASVPVRGRIGFQIGAQGTVQDDLRFAQGLFDVSSDNFEDLTYGMSGGHDPFGFGVYSTQSGSGWSFARVLQQKPGGNVTTFLYGSAQFSGYVGASNRYMYTDQVANNIDTRCIIDVIGDAARVTWTLTNQSGAPLNLGLWYGQWVFLVGGRFALSGNGLDPGSNYGDTLGYISNPTAPPVQQDAQPYVLVPGQKPVVVGHRFIAATDPGNFPAWCDFTGSPLFGSISPQLGGGFQVVNAPYSNVSDENGQSDQTPVDEFDIGDIDFLLGGNGAAITDPKFNDIIFNDAFFSLDCAYLQKWQPTLVANGQSRNIVTYYRSTWGDSSYANGYTAVVDTPKVISSNRSNPSTFDPNPFWIQVNVDNTGGFGLVNTPVPMSNVKVTLKLSQGMYAVGNPTQTTITKVIPSIPALNIGRADFHIQVDPTVFGVLPYSVTIDPSVGAEKVINGSINVAATPTLLVRGGPNLVTSPWVLGNATWEEVLAPLEPEADFQAYTWDPIQQAYVIQTSPVRGGGTWIISKSDHGFFALGGNPSQPTDEFPPSLGAPSVTLQQGWNLVANPYNYSFQLGQLVGVPQGTTTTLPYSQMVAQGIFDGSFAYYQQDLQTYNFIDGNSAYLLPNYGYWVFVTEPVALVFPPVFDLFVRSAPASDTFHQTYNHWKLQLAAQNGNRQDLSTIVGLDTTPNEAMRMQVHKAPLVPVKAGINPNAVRAYVATTSSAASTSQGIGTRSSFGGQYAQYFHTVPGKQVYSYNVYSHKGGNVTITWPNLASIPTNLDVKVTDVTAPGQSVTIDARKAAGYSFTSKAQSTEKFQVTITPLGTVREAINNVTTKVHNAGSTKNMTINWDLTTRGLVSMYVYKGTTHIGTIVVDRDGVVGKNTIEWPMRLLSGQLIQPGNYTLQITATGEGGDTATKLVNLSL
ncbi:MAG TPA: hypothetical protein VG944_10640 [Fimbriimonas sp.]|nr:hypothetical protein [Fimbriimonas sp.]